MHITFVKKLDKDGLPCRKCRDVERRLRDSGYLDYIDEVVIADERDRASEGMRLAEDLDVDRAPFFIVERNGMTEVYTVYYQFLREVIEGPGTLARDLHDSMRR